MMREAITHRWLDGTKTCGKHHHMGVKIHNVIETGHVITVRICSVCGAVRITRTLIPKKHK